MIFIRCSTGCSCCNYENHYRGPYRTTEDAERRINYYKSETSKYWPLASQYARRGVYAVVNIEAEIISNNRIIIADRVFHSIPEAINILEDGSITNDENDKEYFTNKF